MSIQPEQRAEELRRGIPVAGNLLAGLREIRGVVKAATFRALSLLGGAHQPEASARLGAAASLTLRVGVHYPIANRSSRAGYEALMIPDQYVWLIWSSAFLLAWLALYAAFPRCRLVMWRASLLALPFALSEPLFVGRYWSPPSLFDLARTQHFDLESFLFCFSIGGPAAVLFNIVTGQAPAPRRMRAEEARFQFLYPFALGVPLLPFCFVLSWTLRPLWAGAIGMVVGAVARAWCLPDLRAKTWAGGLLFLGYYLVFLVGLLGLAPGYLERAWLAGGPARVRVAGIPVTELVFALCFGAYWSGLYEQLDRTLSLPERPAPDAAGR